MKVNLASTDLSKIPSTYWAQAFEGIRSEIRQRSYMVDQALRDPEESMDLVPPLVAELKAKYNALLDYVVELEQTSIANLAAQDGKGVPIVGDVQLVIGDVDKVY